MVSDIRAISFDCFGTLIDWQTGIRRVMRPALAEAGIFMDDGVLFHQFALLERRAEKPPYKSYKQVLEEVAAGFFEEPENTDCTVLWKSLPDWPAFDETPDALAAIKRRFKLAVVSNVDDDLFAFSEPKLGVELDVVVTADQVRSYKPALPHFHELLERLQLKPAQVLHVAESRYHDIEPANSLGMPTVWINRARGGLSASGEGAGEPMLIVGSLKELVAHLNTRGATA
jgi:2-haloacid dehalogenase